jgi:hypothetical protein
MSTWYSKVFTYPSTEASKQVDESFRALCLAQGGKANGAAVFSVYNQSTKATTFYFSPEARRIAERVEAATCAKPKPIHAFALSIGDPESWQIHFPTFARTPSQPSSRPFMPAVPARRR